MELIVNRFTHVIVHIFGVRKPPASVSICIFELERSGNHEHR